MNRMTAVTLTAHANQGFFKKQNTWKYSASCSSFLCPFPGVLPPKAIDGGETEHWPPESKSAFSSRTSTTNVLLTNGLC